MRAERSGCWWRNLVETPEARATDRKLICPPSLRSARMPLSAALTAGRCDPSGTPESVRAGVRGLLRGLVGCHGASLVRDGLVQERSVGAVG